MERGRVPTAEANTLSKDEYIAKFEAELRGLRPDNSKASSSRAILPFDGALLRLGDNDGDLMRAFTKTKL